MTIFNLQTSLKKFFFSVCLCLSIQIGYVISAEDTKADQNTASNLNVAEFDDDGLLIKPNNLDQWIHVGSNMGQGYNEALFDPASPGTFQIVEIEPSAYDYFKQHGRYANGTMIALSFYKASDKSSPRLNGFHQGELVSFEIHLIDSQNFKEGRAFYNFGMKTVAEKIADGSRCVECHKTEGAFESTFTQFYPKMQNLLSIHKK